MSSQGPNFPTSATGNTGVIGGGGKVWVNPTNIEANDSLSAVVTFIGAQATSDDLIGTGFGFSIPSTATINGILLEISTNSTNGNCGDSHVRLLKGGSPAGSDKATGTFFLSSAIFSYGGASDLWGTTWLPSDVNAANFGAGLVVGCTTTPDSAQIDFFRITVFYTVTPQTGAITLSVTSGISPANTATLPNNTVSLGVTAGFSPATPVQVISLPVTAGFSPSSTLSTGKNNVALAIIAGAQPGIVPLPPVLPVPPIAVQPAPALLSKYTSLITSEHDLKPKFMAMIAAMIQPSVDLQNVLRSMLNAYDIDFAIGAQLDTVGLWVGASRNLEEPISGVFFSWGVSGLGWGQGTWFNPSFNQGVPLLGTRIQSSGGSAILKYEISFGSGVAGHTYTASVLVLNQGLTAVTVNMNAGTTGVPGAFLLIPPGQTVQVNVSIFETGSNCGVGVPCSQQLRFNTAGVGDAMDIVAFNPVYQDNGGPNLITGPSTTFGGSWTGFGGNSVTLTQNFPGLVTSLLITLPDDSYRTLLRGVIAANQWDGTVPGAYEIFNTVFGIEGFQILIVDNQDMTMTIIVLAQVLDAVAKSLLLSGLIIVRPAGVRITGYFGAVQPVFGFGEESSLISGWGVGNWLQLVSF